MSFDLPTKGAAFGVTPQMIDRGDNLPTPESLMPDDTIVVDVKPRGASIPVRMGDETYQMRQLKLVDMPGIIRRFKSDDLDSQMEAIGEWITIAFSAKDAARIAERLNDPDDGLDIMHFVKPLERSMTSAADPTM